jgi:hypothetical protein
MCGGEAVLLLKEGAVILDGIEGRVEITRSTVVVTKRAHLKIYG